MQKAKHLILASVFVLMLGSFGAAQGGPCPVASSTTTSIIPSRSGDLICLVPQVYGGGGLVGTDHGGPLHSTVKFSHAAHFSESSLASFSPLNAEIGTQLSQLPVTSSASGFIFSFNPSLGVVTRQAESFGPILTERAETIGRHRVFLGFSYQFFNFDKADGVNLRNFDATFTHELEPGLCSPGIVPKFTCVNGANGLQPVFQHDIITTVNRIDLKVHQFTAIATVGITNRLDLSVAVPILDVRMGVSSDATIHPFETAADFPPCCLHQFESPNPDPNHEILFPADPRFQFNHASFSNSSAKAGIGDVVLRGKFQALKGERAGLAVGVDVRFPTGDEENFLGSGTYGTRPFITFSYGRRISPHASFGYEINGNSILAGDITRHVDAHLPNVITYSFGADVGVTHRLTLSADFLGQALQNSRKMAIGTYTDPVFNVTEPTITTSRETANQASIAVGGKFNPVGNLLLIANVLFRVNDSGLHSKPVPLVGVSYTF